MRRRLTSGRVEVTQQHVLQHGEGRHHAQLLVDERDPQPLGGRPAAHLHRLLVHEDATPVGVELAGQQLDDRALPGPVVTAERVDLTGAQRDRDVDDGRDAAEAPGEALDAHERTLVGLVR